MSASQPPPRIEIVQPKPRNPETKKQHRKEAFWQIYFPVLASLLFIIAVTVGLLWFTGNPGASVAADYAVLLLLAPLLFVGLILFATIAGLIWVMNKGLTAVPSPAFVAQQYIKKATRIADDATDRIAESLISVKSRMAGITRGLKREGIITEEETQVPPELDPRNKQKSRGAK